LRDTDLDTALFAVEDSVFDSRFFGRTVCRTAASGGELVLIGLVLPVAALLPKGVQQWRLNPVSGLQLDSRLFLTSAQLQAACYFPVLSPNFLFFTKITYLAPEKQ